MLGAAVCCLQVSAAVAAAAAAVRVTWLRVKRQQARMICVGICALRVQRWLWTAHITPSQSGELEHSSTRTRLEVAPHALCELMRSITRIGCITVQSTHTPISHHAHQQMQLAVGALNRIACVAQQ